MEDKITVSITILLTGFVVVFAVLLLLIGIIKLYGTIVYKIQNKDKAAPKIDVVLNESEKQLLEENIVETDDGEIIAVIAAAVDSIYGVGKTKIKSIKKQPASKSMWRNTGVLENTRPF